MNLSSSGAARRAGPAAMGRIGSISLVASTVLLASAPGEAQTRRPSGARPARAVGVEVTNFSLLKEQVAPSDEDVAMAFARAIGDRAMVRRVRSMDWPDGVDAADLVLALLEMAAPSEIRSTARVNNRFMLMPVDDFDAYCEAIDFGRIVARDSDQCVVRVRIDPAELSFEKIRNRARRTGRSIDSLRRSTSGLGVNIPRGFGSRRDSDRRTLLESTQFDVGAAVEAQFGSRWVAGEVVEGGEDDWSAVRFDDVRQFEPLIGQGRDARRLLRVASVTLPVLNGDLRQGAAGGVAATPRTWTDRTGKFSVEAAFRGLEGGAVTLQRADGRTVTVPLAKLSAADADYVRSVAAADENPFRAAPAEPKAQAKTLTADETGVRVIKRTSGGWSFKPDAPAASPPPQVHARPVDLNPLPNSKLFFEKLLGLYVSKQGKCAIVYRQAGDVGQDDRRYLEALDLVNGRNLGLVPLPAESAVLDARPSTLLVVMRPDEFGFDNKSQLFFQQLGGAVLDPLLTWDAGDDVENAWFLPGGRLLTADRRGDSLTVWRCQTAQAELRVPVETPYHVHFGPRRRLMAVTSRGAMDLYDLAEGRHLGTLPFPGQFTSRAGLASVAIRPDQTEMAVVTTGCVTLWDLRAGREVRRLLRPEIVPQLRMALGPAGGLSFSARWVGDYLLVNGRYLYDLERRILLWEYDLPGGDFPGRGGGRTVAAGRLWYTPPMTDSLGAYLASTPVPHQAAVDMANYLGDAEELLVSRPGDPVELAVDIAPSVAGGDKVRAAVVENLEAAGLRVANSAPLVVIVTCKPLPRQEIRLRHRNQGAAFMRRGFNEKIITRTIEPHVSEVRVIHGGKDVFRRGVTYTPGGVVSLREGESVDDALERLTTPDLNAIMNMKFNAYMARQGDATERGAYGLSKLASEGVFEDVTARAE